MDSRTFEARLLIAMGICALIIVVCLVSLWLERRRRPSPFRSAEFRRAHVQPTQKAAPTVATVIEPRQSANPTREWERQTNHGMF